MNRTKRWFAPLFILALSAACATTQPAPSETPAPQPSAVSSTSPSPVPSATSSPVVSSQARSAIFGIAAAATSCTKYNYRTQGTPPIGLVKGVALTFARTLCRLRSGERGIADLTSEPALTAKTSKDPSRDVLNWYGLATSSPEERLKTVYALEIGHAMLESSGRYYCGADENASNHSADTAEAGLLQTSYNSASADSRFDPLMDEYLTGAFKTKCELDVFREGVSKPYPEVNYGTGRGLAFQHLSKTCPAFAVEYAAGLVRVLRNHYGPLNSHRAELASGCFSMLDQVEAYIASNPDACDAVL